MFTLYNNENDSEDKALFVNTTPNKNSSKSYDTSPGQTKRIHTIKTLIKQIEVYLSHPKVRGMRFLNIIQSLKISKLTMKLYASLQMIQVGLKRKFRVMQRFYETNKKKVRPKKFQIEYHLKRGKGTTF